MAFELKKVDYFYLSVPGETGEACQLLEGWAGQGINLLAFAAVPFGQGKTQLTLFPEDAARLQREGAQARLTFDGPHPAILAQGDDELGALATVHQKLDAAGAEVYATSGVADGRGGYGYVIYLRPSSLPEALTALEL
ncbi:MAG: hypothetical protein HOP15_03375 [Planctomycetes bacterium]|nr:hypothetical protein [Planctomycetota bacterium]